jgi:serine/threonine protein kinase
MSVIKATSGQQQVDTRKCPNCKTILPPQAQFCGTCGRRMSRESQSINSSSLRVANDIHKRYRITSLIRRRPYVQLLMATDLPYQRPVIIRDIDISSLSPSAQALARQAVEEEYNQLRSRLIQDVMLLVDFHPFDNHIYTVAEWPSILKRREQQERSLYTLDDLLQSGIGLPYETEAVLWIERLAQAVAHLHNLQIVLSDLDPYAISVSSDSYEGLPALMVSWLPQAIRKLLPPPPAKTYTGSFFAPETSKGEIRPQSDIYSLGAILYLLLTGTAPTIKAQAKKHNLRSPRELRSTITPGLDALVMCTLASDPSERFESAQSLAEALRDLITTPVQPASHTLINTVFKGKRDALDLPAGRPFKPASPYSTRVLPAVPPLPPSPAASELHAVSTPAPQVAHPEPGISPAVSGPATTGKADLTAQPPPADIAENATDIQPVSNDQGKHPLAIEDIETIIINASEFEAALAQATHHLLTDEEEDLYTRLANEAPTTLSADAIIPTQPAPPDEHVFALPQATSYLITPASLSTQRADLPEALTLDDITNNNKIVEEQVTMTPEEEIEPHIQIEGPGEQEMNIADIPTASFHGPDPAILEAQSSRKQSQEEIESIPTAEDQQASTAQATSPITDEEENTTEQAASYTPSPPSSVDIEEASTLLTPLAIEDIATQAFAPPIRLSIPAELEADESTIEQAAVSPSHDTERSHVDQPVPAAPQPTHTEHTDQAAPPLPANRALASEEESVQQPFLQPPLSTSSDSPAGPASPASPASQQDDQAATEKPAGKPVKSFFTGPIPILPRLLPNRGTSSSPSISQQPTLDQIASNAEKLLRHLRHFVLGQQQHNTSAAALIETPLRIQPGQNYTIRIQIMGRDTPRQRGVGLSGLMQNEYVHIEVRSALYHKYAYIVQQADIRLPGNGFAAAVTIPMKPLSDGPSGRRERLHVYFMDEQRNLLYEKPFAIEIFISPLVQPGREGHNVLPIPL